MEKVRPWRGQPSDRGRLKNRTEQCEIAESTTHICRINDKTAKLTLHSKWRQIVSTELLVTAAAGLFA